MSQVYVTAAPPTSNAGGLTFFDDDVQGTVKQIKGSKGLLYFLSLSNSAAAQASFLQVFFKPAASVILGVTAPDWVIHVPPLATTGGHARDITLPIPIGGGGTGLSVAGTTAWNGAVGVAIGVSAIYK